MTTPPSEVVADTSETAQAVTAAPPVPTPHSTGDAETSSSSPAAVVEATVPVTNIETTPPSSKLGITSSQITARRPSTVASGAPPPVPAQATTTAAASQPRTTTKTKKKKSAAGGAANASGSQSGSQGAQGENTGRWTAEEHRLFLQGLEQHGKGWKKIASLIKSRTVVQIRTHAQKYFQKLAKARQNGEEGEIAMEGRGGDGTVTSVSTSAAAQTNKRRRQATGTKRKVLQSVVASAQRQGKKMAMMQDGSCVPIPNAAPALAHFLLPHAPSVSGAPSLTNEQGVILGSALEDSLFRFLTPAPVIPIELQVNDIARQAGANPITLPSENPSSAPSFGGGETSPTGVADLAIYPSWTDAKDPPSWYTKGSDVDALLDVADTLDWLTDTGDLNETYEAPPDVYDDGDDASETSLGDIDTSDLHPDLAHSIPMNSASVCTLPHVDSNVESVVPPLPSLFDGTGVDLDHHEIVKAILAPSMSVTHLNVSTSGTDLHVFDTPMEEHDFVSTLLETHHESSDSLPILD